MAGYSSPVVMTNLLGDLWSRGDPDWETVFQEPQAKLHLYGKQEARPDRKMGHINCLAEDTEGALEIAESIRKQLTP